MTKLNKETADAIQIGYSDFILLCNIDDPKHWYPSTEVKTDGVWIVPVNDDILVSAQERAILCDHPEKDLSIPALSFPCSFTDFKKFLEWLGGDIQNYVIEDNLKKFVQRQIQSMPAVSPEPAAPAKESAPNPQDEPATKDQAPAIPSGGPQLEPLPDNCLIRKKLFWIIRFQGIESDAVKDVVGMRYIERLLDNPGKSYSCAELLELHTKIDAYRPSMSKDAAIGQGLHADHRRQEISDQKSQGEYWKKQIELENERTGILDADDSERTPEDVLRLKEIEQELSELKSSNRHLNFTDKVSGQQSLVRTNLKKAYDIIRKDKKMADFMKHIKDDRYIRADGSYGYVYVGNIKWEKCK